MLAPGEALTKDFEQFRGRMIEKCDEAVRTPAGRLTQKDGEDSRQIEKMAISAPGERPTTADQFKSV
jgi:hypothetical protein